MDDNTIFTEEQLKDWRCILVIGNGKKPTAEMKGWTEDRDRLTYAYESPDLLKHFKQGGNYGICADKDRFIIATDTKEAEKAVEDRLPATFTVRSHRHKTKHFLFYGEITKNIHCKPTAQGDPCIDIKYGNVYAVGPGCTFKDPKPGLDYGKYEVVDDRPIASCS